MLPERGGRLLSQDQIYAAVRSIYKMKECGDEDVFSRVSDMHGIGISKLYELWNEYVRTEKMPEPAPSRRMSCMELVGMEWFETIRAEVERMRLENRKAVEVPDIQKFLVESHGISIGRVRLCYRLHKMGFMFGKTKKLVMKKEEPRIRTNFARIT